MKRNFSSLKVILISAALVAACGETDAPTSDPDATDGDLYERLVSSAVPVDHAIEVDVSGMSVEDPNDPRRAVGVTAPVDALIELSSLNAADLSKQAMSATHGAIRADGSGFVYTAVVRADGAAALRINLTDVFLPRNARLYIYNETGDVDGPYTARGPRGAADFWTKVLNGDQLTLQVHYDGSDTDRVLDSIRFNVFDVGYLDDRWPMARYTADAELQRSFCSYNAACVENANCGSLPAAVSAARGGVAEMLFASGPYQYICTGGLIADTDSGSNRALFLTANHCISRGREASSLQTWFNFETSCGGACEYAWNLATPATTGATILAGNRSSDYTLLELNSAPSGATHLPFNPTPVAFADGTQLFRISHPAGAPQAYSTHTVDTSYGTCSSWPRGNWIYSRDTYGATEGGSSGSPVLNAAGEVVGQLSGGCGTNISDDCDPESNATVDGALAAYYGEVEAILDPSGSPCVDADGDGWCDGDDCNDSDPSINPGATDICDDGIDQDCSGSDCTTGSCDALPVGASCVSDAECCSNKCKGKPGGKTCK